MWVSFWLTQIIFFWFNNKQVIMKRKLFTWSIYFGGKNVHSWMVFVVAEWFCRFPWIDLWEYFVKFVDVFLWRICDDFSGFLMEGVANFWDFCQKLVSRIYLMGSFVVALHWIAFKCMYWMSKFVIFSLQCSIWFFFLWTVKTSNISIDFNSPNLNSTR